MSELSRVIKMELDSVFAVRVNTHTAHTSYRWWVFSLRKSLKWIQSIIIAIMTTEHLSCLFSIDLIGSTWNVFIALALEEPFFLRQIALTRVLCVEPGLIVIIALAEMNEPRYPHIDDVVCVIIWNVIGDNSSAAQQREWMRHQKQAHPSSSLIIFNNPRRRRYRRWKLRQPKSSQKEIHIRANFPISMLTFSRYLSLSFVPMAKERRRHFRSMTMTPR